ERNEEGVLAQDGRVLAAQVLGEHELAVAERGEELGPRSPRASGRVGKRPEDARRLAEGVRVEELPDPVLVVAGPGPLDRGARVGLDDPDGAARHDEWGDRRQVDARREALA